MTYTKAFPTGGFPLPHVTPNAAMLPRVKDRRRVMNQNVLVWLQTPPMRKK